MIIELQPDDKGFDELLEMTQRNMDTLFDYTLQGALKYEIPVSSKHFFIAAQIEQVLTQGGRVLLLTPDSDVPQELTLEQEV